MTHVHLPYQEVCAKDTPIRLMQDPEIGHKKIDLTLSDATVRMWAPDAIFNLLCWQLYVRFQIPIQQRHIIPRPNTSAGNLAAIYTEIHNELLAAYADQPTARKTALFETINDLYNFIVEELPEYVTSFDVLDLTEILTESPVADIISDMNIQPGMGSELIEEKISRANSKFLDTLGTPGAIKNESLLAFQQTKTLNPLQASQMCLAFGLRTDIDDTIVLYPVTGSAMSGLKNIQEYAVEALAGIKPTFYNKVGVRISQYMGRKQHIVASSLTTIYPGDCGTNLTVNFRVTNNNYKNLVSKYHVVGNELRLFRTEEDVKPYIDKQVKLRSPMVCRHQDGVCCICGGLILTNLNPKLGIGLLSSSTFISIVTQNILSAKHLIRTISQSYVLPTLANEYFTKQREQLRNKKKHAEGEETEADKIHWHREATERVPNWLLGVSLKDFSAGSFSDLTTIKKIGDVRESTLSQLRSVVLKDIKTGNTVTIPLEVKGQCPFFTKEMLLHIKEWSKYVIRDSYMVWIPMAGTEDIPIFQTVVINDNIMAFVNSVETFLKGKVSKFTTCQGALEAFSDLVLSKAPGVNMMHLEIMLKAYQISGPTDYRIPRVEDPDNVLFSVTAAVISRRSIGQMLAFQSLKAYLRNPATYLAPVGDTVFDPLLGLL